MEYFRYLHLQSYPDREVRGDIIRAARTLGDLLSRKLTPLAPLAAVTEVKVETTVITTTTNGEYYLKLQNISLITLTILALQNM